MGTLSRRIAAESFGARVMWFCVTAQRLLSRYVIDPTGSFVLRLKLEH